MKRHKRNVGSQARHDEHARAARGESQEAPPPGRGSSGRAEHDDADEAPDRFGAKGTGRDDK